MPQITITEILNRRKELHEEFLETWDFSATDADLDWAFSNWLVQRTMEIEFEKVGG